jgi:hypothetical protein
LADRLTTVVLTALLGLGISKELKLDPTLVVAVSVVFTSSRIIVRGSSMLAVAISTKVPYE